MGHGWKYAAASVIGTSHLKTPNGICQDAHACTYLPDWDRLVCAVSDGAGSAALSDRGSRIACDVVAEAAAIALPSEIHTKAFAIETITHIRAILAEQAANEGAAIREYSCTLLVAIIDANGTTFWQLGDGAICFRLALEDQFKYAFWPDKGEYANTTFFVTDSEFASELEFDSSQIAIADLALFSDGLERLALDFKLGEAHTKFFSGFFPALYLEPAGHRAELDAKLAAFLSSERVNKQTDDDKTLVLVTLESR